jgi:hypothetical protein
MGLSVSFLCRVCGGHVVDPAGQHHVHGSLDPLVLGHEGVMHVVDLPTWEARHITVISLQSIEEIERIFARISMTTFTVLPLNYFMLQSNEQAPPTQHSGQCAN